LIKILAVRLFPQILLTGLVNVAAVFAGMGYFLCHFYACWC